MDHNYAINNHVAEGYLLNDLDQNERNDYEEHYFSCAVCADQVKAASEFITNAKRVIQAELQARLLSETKRHTIWGNWLNWKSIMQPLPVAACLLAVALGGFIIPQLRQMASAQPEGVTLSQIAALKPYLLSNSSRGASSSSPVIKQRGKPFELQVEIPAPDFDSYSAEIKTKSGATEYRFHPISKDEALNPVKLLVQRESWKSGEYVLVIQGIAGSTTPNGVKGEPVSFSFQLNVQD